MSHTTNKTMRLDLEIPQDSPNQLAIISECDGIKHLLLEKNKSYGDAALNPLRVFSKATPVEQIKVRIDDKLSRIARGNEYLNEDTIQDLIGYLVLYRIALKQK